MQARPSNHPSPADLRALGADQLDEATAEAIFAHLDACPDCCRAAITLTGDRFLRLRAARPAAVTTPDAPRPGDTNGPHPAPAQPQAAIPPELRDHPEFEVLSKLGGGGMGVVYLAKNRLMKRLEALKVVTPYLAAQPGVAERFIREICALAQLRHPNIATAYRALRAGDLLVLVMEYVPGKNLAEVVKAGGPLPVVNACYYAQQVAVGLQHAFEKGMVHRDIKPGNLLLAREGKRHAVKILDFGLVKATVTDGESGYDLTGSGLGMGTPDYMAPEQVRDASRADVRADVYSLGCTLYFLLAGRPPFQGKSQYEICEAHCSTAAKPLNEVRKDVPAELAAVVAKMMAKDPARRYQKPVEVAQALAPFVKTVLKSLPAVPPPEGGAKPRQPRPSAGDGKSEIRKMCAQETELPGAVIPDAPAPKPVAVPVTIIEGQDTIARAKKGRDAEEEDSTAKPTSKKKGEDGRRDKSARKPATKPSGGSTMTVLLGAIGLLLMVGCAGGIYWAVSKGSDGGNQLSSEFAYSLGTKKGGTWDSPAAPKIAHKSAPPQKATERITPPRSTGVDGSKPVEGLVAKVKTVSGIDLVSIPKGSFYMGSTGDDKDAYEDEKPRHKVTISQPFYLGKFHVTVGQFKRFVNAEGYQTEAEKASDKWTWKNPVFDQTNGHPVVWVSWNDADAFCQWLAKETGAKVRLPREAEWEYSCHAVTEAKKPTTKFYFGDNDADLGDYAWYDKNSGYGTHACGLKKPNDFGLYDMHGLVYEWCADGRRTYTDQDETDPEGPSAGAFRVRRGGSFAVPPRICRAANRFVLAPSFRYGDVGFRVLVSR